MAPTLLQRWEKTEEAPSHSEKTPMEPLYIVGIVLACLIFAGGAGWWAFRYIKETRKDQRATNRSSVLVTSEKAHSTLRPLPPNAFNRAKLTASIVLPRRLPESGLNPNAEDPKQAIQAMLPPVRPLSMALKANRSHSSLPSRHSQLRMSTLPNGQTTQSNMSEQDIIDHHIAEGNFPISFAPFAITLGGVGDVAHNRDSHGSLPSLGVVPGHKPTFSGSSHSRFSSFSASVRNSVASWNGSGLSPTKSNFTFGKKHSHSPSAVLASVRAKDDSASTDERSVKLTFNPLLPDELVVKLNEKVNVVQSFDDGWCIVGRMNLGMLEVGAVPEFVFGAMGSDSTRPMRSSSLGITIDLRIVEEEMETGRKRGNVAPAGARDSIVSWSNF